jgi:aspartate aminotransferase-like enzyme
VTEAAAGADLRPAKPKIRPARPFFSSGPCAKPPGWQAQSLDTSALGRSHRGAIGKAKLQEAIDRTHALLRLPKDYKLGIVPASDTGAMEMAIWSLLGPRPVTMLAWESFGEGWVTDVAKQLGLDAEIRTADYGEICDLSRIDPANDVVFTWNGTTSGVRVPNAEWIAADRSGLTICDATSAAFAQPLDWAKLDVVTFSWQKALAAGFVPILCVGETEEERERGDTERKLRHQVQEGLDKVPVERLPEVVIAYEPVWAIGTGLTASSEQAQDACGFVRALVAGFDKAAAQAVRILYGGSLKPEGAEELLALPDIDGGLIGGASLEPKDFASIVQTAARMVAAA